MGIQGLLPLLKSIMKPIHIKDLEGCCVAVDTYSWLHKGALSCSKELCKGLPTSKHIDYCMHRVNLLRHYGVKPVLVFDGGLLPMKSEQENKRARARRENISRAMEHEANGNLTAAYECYQKAVDISPSVAYDLIQVLKRENIDYIVAPYEADAQMTFLALIKQVDAVITEDSDLIAFGCSRIIYKMDKFGQAVEFRYSILHQNKELNFTGFTKQMLLEMCILSGCDYLQSLPGMGLKKAHALMKKFKSYEKVLKHLKYNSVSVSPIYEESFKKAILTFQHQRVYDPVTEEIVHMSELPENVDENLDFLGPSIPQHEAKGIATGDLDPFTKMPLQGECGGAELIVSESHLLKNFKPDGEKKRLDLPVQKNILTNYFCFASLEAKRKFRLPRNSPNNLNPKQGTVGTVADTRTGVNFQEVDYSAATTDSAILEPKFNGLHDIEVIEVDNGTRHDFVQDSIYKPCSGLHKERPSDPNQSNARAKSCKTIVRSSYFLHKSKGKNNLSASDDKDDAVTLKCPTTIANYEHRSASDDNEKKLRTNTNGTVRSSYFQHKSKKEEIEYDKNEKLLVRETITPNYNTLFGLDEVERNAQMDEGNRIWRNSYIQQNSGSKNRKDRKYEKLSVEDGIPTDRDEYSLPEISSFRNGFVESTTKKQKVTFVDNFEAEDSRENKLLVDAVPPAQSDTNSNTGDTAVETNTSEGKFGCNISHLGHYSEIAEKSMENFVSVISSFRFTSSGSRASGLRAPLKDIRNTCINKSQINRDLSKFAYTPTTKASGRRKV